MRRPLRRILTPGERAALRAHESEMRVQLETPTIMMGPNGRPVRVADRSNLESPETVSAQMRRTRKVLEEGSPHDLTKAEKRERDRAIRILEERIRKKMVPEKQFRMPDDGGAEYRKVVGALVEQARDPKLNEEIQMLKNLKRERDPENPNAGNIEDLRK